jgi:ferredoxin
MSLLYYTSAIVLELDTGKCSGCGRCVEVCPHNVFELTTVMQPGATHPVRRAKIIGRERCMECGACAMNCTTGAIKAGRGVGCAAAIINGMIRGTEPSCDCGGKGNGCGCK